MLDDDFEALQQQQKRMIEAMIVSDLQIEPNQQGPKINSIKYFGWSEAIALFGSANSRYNHLFGFSKVSNIKTRSKGIFILLVLLN